MKQRTIKNPLTLEGIGLHSGTKSSLTIYPAKENSGIVFKRKDLAENNTIPALYNYVVDTQNCTCLGNEQGARVSTIEHLMAALSMCGIDNALIEVDALEVPIMDGSGLIFYNALKESAYEELPADRKYLKVLKGVSFTDSKASTVRLSPAENFSVHMEIEFPSQIVGHQVFDSEITSEIFGKEILCALNIVRFFNNVLHYNKFVKKGTNPIIKPRTPPKAVIALSSLSAISSIIFSV